MTRNQQNRFLRALETKRSELLREIGDRRERLAIDPTNDPLDLVCGKADRDLNIDNVDRMASTLRLVEGALREIREGTFGVCAECGGKIPLKRLEAVPWSPYCVSCQQRLEESEGGEGHDGKTQYALAGMTAGGV